MSIRKTVCDYAGNELHPGDLVNYSSRTGNRVRVADAVIKKVTTDKSSGRVVPMLHLIPTGIESGFVKRRSFRTEHVGAEHVRLLMTAEELRQE